MRLFFDLLKQESPSYDFHGHDVGKPDDAAQIAELIAADLGWSESSEWVGSQVVVRDTAGKLLFANSHRGGRLKVRRAFPAPASLKF